MQNLLERIENMKIKKIISIMIATALVLAVMATNVFAAYNSVKADSRVIDRIECYTKGGYDQTTGEVDAFSIMTSLRGNETVTLKSYAAIDIRYASGNINSSPLESSSKTVSQSYDGIRTYAEMSINSAEILSVIYYSHWYYANDAYVYGCTYNKELGVNTL